MLPLSYLAFAVTSIINTGVNNNINNVYMSGWLLPPFVATILAYYSVAIIFIVEIVALLVIVSIY